MTCTVEPALNATPGFKDQSNFIFMLSKPSISGAPANSVDLNGSFKWSLEKRLSVCRWMINGGKSKKKDNLIMTYIWPCIL